MKEPKILIVKFTAIGDCVMALPVASRIRRSQPDAQIDWVIDSRCSDVVQCPGLVDRLHIQDGQRLKQRRWTLQCIRDQLLFFRELRQEHYDFGIDLQGHSKTAICLRLANPRTRVAVRATDRLAKSLNPVAPNPPRSQHSVEQNLDTLAEIGFQEGDASPILPDLQAEVEALKGQFRPPLCTIAVGAGHPKKVVPREHWIHVAKGLLREGFSVAFLGGPTDKPIHIDSAIDWVGKLRLRQTMVALSASELHLSGDTGTGHIASALGVPTVTVFGHVAPETYRPYWGDNRTLSIGGEARCVPHSAIFAAAMDLWRSRAQ